MERDPDQREFWDFPDAHPEAPPSLEAKELRWGSRILSDCRYIETDDGGLIVKAMRGLPVRSTHGEQADSP